MSQSLINEDGSGSNGSRTPEALLPSGAEAAYSIRYGNRRGTSIVTWPWASAGKGGKAMGTPGTWAIHESVALSAERPALSCSVFRDYFWMIIAERGQRCYQLSMPASEKRTVNTKALIAVFGTLLTIIPNTSFASMTNWVTNLEDSAPGSLRQVINGSQSGDSVLFRTNGMITLTSGEIYLTNSINLCGFGSGNIEIGGNNASRVFHVCAGTTSSMSGLLIRDGRTSDGITNSLVSGNGGDGGGIFNAGVLTMSRCVLTANRTGNGGAGVLENDGRRGDGGSGGSGGALYNAGTLILRNCTVTTNSTGYGGAGASSSSNLQVATPGGNGGRGGVGGGIYNIGRLVVTGCVFSGNSASSGGNGGFGGLAAGGAGGGGGAIWNKQGTGTMTACTISGNRCGNGGSGGPQGLLSSVIPYPAGGNGGVGGNGAGIGNQAGDLSITTCTISANHCGRGQIGGAAFYASAGAGGVGGSGAGIWNDNGIMTVSACTISSNSCGDGGSGNYQNGPGAGGGAGAGIGNQNGILTVIACTITGNSGGAGGLTGFNTESPPPRATARGGSGGGIAALGGPNTLTALQNTLIAQNLSGTEVHCCYSTNFAPGLDMVGTFTSLGHNLIGASNASVGFVNGTNGDLVGTTDAPIVPMLGSLLDNGGLTLTHALLAGSPALDAGTSSGLSSDQRGEPRTIDNPAVLNAADSDGTDIGAFEVNHILTGKEVHRSGSDILVRFTSVSDKTYGVEYKSEVDSIVWTLLPGSVAGTGGFATYTNTDAADLPSRFYRVFEH